MNCDEDLLVAMKIMITVRRLKYFLLNNHLFIRGIYICK